MSEQIAWLEPRDFVRLVGLPFEEDSSDWHVNDKMVFSAGGAAFSDLLTALTPDGVESDDVSEVYVLQRADASEDWLTLVLEDGEVAEAFRTEHPEGDHQPFDYEGLNVVAISDNRGDLKDD